MAEVKLNPNERKVLKALAASYEYEGFGFLSFAMIRMRTRQPRPLIRRCARSLARKGLAEYGRGLWTEDGEVAGSGYCCTPAGAKLLGML